MELMKARVIDINDIFQTYDFINSPFKAANKFVILENLDEIVLITGDINRFPYHATLIEWYCVKNNIAFSWSHKPDFVEIFESKYSIRGGGYVVFHRDKMEYEFFGFSTAYGRFENKKLNYIFEQNPIFNSTRISISR